MDAVMAFLQHAIPSGTLDSSTWPAAACMQHAKGPSFPPHLTLHAVCRSHMLTCRQAVELQVELEGGPRLLGVVGQH
jgi:hypothetical protein